MELNVMSTKKLFWLVFQKAYTYKMNENHETKTEY